VFVAVTEFSKFFNSSEILKYRIFEILLFFQIFRVCVHDVISKPTKFAEHRDFSNATKFCKIFPTDLLRVFLWFWKSPIFWVCNNDVINAWIDYVNRRSWNDLRNFLKMTKSVSKTSEEAKTKIRAANHWNFIRMPPL